MIDIGTRDKLVEKYYPFAVWYGNRYKNLVKDPADRRSYAGEALINAIESWNPSGGASIKTYIKRCINGRMMKHARDLGATKRSAPPMQSLDQEFDIGYGAYTLHDILASDSIDPQDYLVQQERMSIIQSVLSELPKDQRDILDSRYISQSMLQTDIAQQYKRTQVWAHRTERVGLEYLRKKLVKSGYFSEYISNSRL